MLTTPLMQDHRQNGARAVPVELQKHDRLGKSGYAAAAGGFDNGQCYLL
jgi:hypothetical protein